MGGLEGGNGERTIWQGGAGGGSGLFWRVARAFSAGGSRVSTVRVLVSESRTGSDFSEFDES